MTMMEFAGKWPMLSRCLARIALGESVSLDHIDEMTTKDAESQRAKKERGEQ